MRLSRNFGVIAAVLSLAVIGLVAAPIVYGQTVRYRADAQAGSRQGDGPRAFEVFGAGGPRLGVSVKDLDTADLAKLKGATERGVAVEQVNEDSAAAKAGLKDGDIIVQFDGENVRSASQFVRLVRETPVGRAVKVGVLRDGKRLDLTATLDSPERMGWVGEGTVRPEVERNMQRQMDALRNRMQEMPRGRMAPDSPMGRFYFAPRDFNMWLGPESRGRLGVTVQDLTPDLATYFGVKNGVLVGSVEADSPAAKAGLKAGDVITSVNDSPVAGTDELVAALRDKSGDVSVGVVRDKKAMTLKATLETRPSRSRVLAGSKPT